MLKVPKITFSLEEAKKKAEDPSGPPEGSLAAHTARVAARVKAEKVNATLAPRSGMATFAQKALSVAKALKTRGGGFTSPVRGVDFPEPEGGATQEIPKSETPEAKFAREKEETLKTKPELLTGGYKGSKTHVISTPLSYEERKKIPHGDVTDLVAPDLGSLEPSTTELHAAEFEQAKGKIKGSALRPRTVPGMGQLPTIAKVGKEAGQIPPEEVSKEELPKFLGARTSKGDLSTIKNQFAAGTAASKEPLFVPKVQPKIRTEYKDYHAVEIPAHMAGKYKSLEDDSPAKYALVRTQELQGVPTVYNTREDTELPAEELAKYDKKTGLNAEGKPRPKRDVSLGRFFSNPADDIMTTMNKSQSIGGAIDAKENKRIMHSSGEDTKRKAIKLAGYASGEVFDVNNPSHKQRLERSLTKVKETDLELDTKAGKKHIPDLQAQYKRAFEMEDFTDKLDEPYDNKNPLHIHNFGEQYKKLVGEYSLPLGSPETKKVREHQVSDLGPSAIFVGDNPEHLAKYGIDPKNLASLGPKKLSDDASKFSASRPGHTMVVSHHEVGYGGEEITPEVGVEIWGRKGKEGKKELKPGMTGQALVPQRYRQEAFAGSAGEGLDSTFVSTDFQHAVATRKDLKKVKEKVVTKVKGQPDLVTFKDKEVPTVTAAKVEPTIGFLDWHASLNRLRDEAASTEEDMRKRYPVKNRASRVGGGLRRIKKTPGFTPQKPSDTASALDHKTRGTEMGGPRGFPRTTGLDAGMKNPVGNKDDALQDSKDRRPAKEQRARVVALLGPEAAKNIEINAMADVIKQAEKKGAIDTRPAEGPVVPKVPIMTKNKKG
jgi:hypothetical protein